MAPASVMSAASAAPSGTPSSRVSIGEDGPAKPGSHDDLMDESTFWAGARGALYTVSHSKARHAWPYVAFRLFFHWLQLWLLVVGPQQFNIDSSRLYWRIFSWVSMTQFMSTRGYTFFVACFYLLVASAVCVLVVSWWIGWATINNKLDSHLPVEAARWWFRIFVQSLDVMTVSILLIPLRCQMFGRPDEVIGYNEAFPNVYCWTMPNLVNVAVAIVFIPVAVSLAVLFAVGEVELDITTSHPMAYVDARVEASTVLARMAMTIIAALIYNARWASVLLLGFSMWLTWLTWYWQPHTNAAINHVRTGMYASVAMCAFLYMLGAFYIGFDAGDGDAMRRGVDRLTAAMWALTIPIGLLGALASYLRERNFHRVVAGKFREHLKLDLELNSKPPYLFEDSRLVVRVAKGCLAPRRDAPGLDPESVQLASNVMQMALYQMPKDPFLVVLHAAYLINVLGTYQAGYALLQEARQLDPSYMLSMAIFTLQQQQSQRSAAQPGTRAAELANLVEFQRNYQVVAREHRKAMACMTQFWESLGSDDVSMRTMEKCIVNLSRAIAQGEKAYKQVLQRHDDNTKLMRLWAKFLEHAKFDPWAAAGWLEEADRLEAQQERQKALRNLENWELPDTTIKEALAGGLLGVSSAQDDRGAVIMNAQSQLIMANQVACDLLGYTRQEIKYKDVKVILPPQIQEMHPTYIKNYLLTGKTSVMNRTMMQVAVHKDKRLVPINVTVLKIRGTGEDTLFLAIMTAVPVHDDESTVWVMPDGSVMGVCANYPDRFGFSAKEVAHKPLVTLATKGAKQLEEALRLASAAMRGKSASATKARNAKDSPTVQDAAQVEAKIGTEPEPHAAAAQQLIPRPPSDDPAAGPGASPARHGRPPFARTQPAANAAVATRVSDATRAAGTRQQVINQMDALLEQQAQEAAVLRPAPSLLAAEVQAGLARRRSVRMNSGEVGDDDLAATPVRPAGGITSRMSSFASVTEDGGATLLSLTSPGPRAAPQAPPVTLEVDASGSKWRVLGLQLAHKFAEDVPVDVSIINAGMASLVFHVVTIKRHQAPAMPSGFITARGPGGGGLGAGGGGSASTPALRAKKKSIEKPELAAVPRSAVPGTSILVRSSTNSTTAAAGQGVSRGTTGELQPAGSRSRPSSAITALAQAQQQQDMMLVFNTKGDAVHVTRSVLEHLGRARPATGMAAASASLTVDQLLAEPFAQIHRSLLQVTPPASVPTYSCRAGVTVLLNGVDMHGRPQAMPFRLIIRKRQAGEDIVHVAQLQPSSLAQALDERRLVYELDDKGTIVSHVSITASATLFGFEPEGVVGRSMMSILDIMAVGDTLRYSKSGTAHDPAKATPEVAQVLQAMVRESMKHPGMSWRVGVMAPQSETAAAVSAAASKISGIANKRRPAIMVLMVEPGTGRNGSSIRIQMHLWRAELAASVVTVDSAGHVVATDWPEMHELYPPGLVLGSSCTEMTGKHVGDLLKPLKARPLTDLFVPGAIGPPPNANKGGAKRGGLKQAKAANEVVDAHCGPQQTVVVQHAGDSATIHLCLQAVRKPGKGEAAISLIVRPLAPTNSRPQLAALLLGDTAATIAPGPHLLQHIGSMARGGPGLGRPRHSNLLAQRTSKDAEERVVGLRRRTGTGDNGSDDRRDDAQAAAPDALDAAAEKDHDGPDEMPKPRREQEEEDEEEPEEDSTRLSSLGDFKRGQRFKKLFKLLGGNAVQGPLNTYQRRACLVLLTVVAIQLAAFAVMYEEMMTQISLENNLAYIGRAGAYAAEVGTLAHYLVMLYTNNTAPGLRYLTGPSDIPYIKQRFKAATDEYSRLHRNLYLGSESKPQKVPQEFGLPELWEDATIPITLTANVQRNQSLGDMTTLRLVQHNYTASLWEAGNTLILRANSLWNNIDRYDAARRELDVARQPDFLWIVSSHELLEHYLLIIDAYQGLVQKHLSTINTMQLVLLGALGVALCALITAWMWRVLAVTEWRRFSIYYIFTAVPGTVVRRLSTVRYTLDEEEKGAEEDDDMFGAAAAARAQQQQGGRGDLGGQSTRIKLKVAADAQRVSWVRQAMPWLFKRRLHPAEMANTSKKTLTPSSIKMFIMLTPLLLWGVLNILANGIGYAMVDAMRAPVATFTKANYVLALHKVNSFYTVRLVKENTIQTVPPLRALVALRSRVMRTEYDKMVYGGLITSNNSKETITDDSVYLSLTTNEGVAFSGSGTDVLFGNDVCLCANQSECQPPNSSLYYATRAGLDRLMLRYFELGSYIENFQGLDPALDGPEVTFLLNTSPDIEGGFRRLVDEYLTFVDASTQSVVKLHEIALGITLALMLVSLWLIMKPPIARLDEARICAQMLSQLPPEVDTGGILRRTLLLDIMEHTNEALAVDRDKSFAKSAASTRSGAKGL